MELDRGEVLRYLGVGGIQAPAQVAQLVDGVAAGVEKSARPRYTWRVFTLERTGEVPHLAGTEVELPGQTAKRMLEACGRCVLLAATMGADFDAALRAAQAGDMARAVVLDACGSAGVEWVCDRAEEEIRTRLPSLHLTDRFSPGYGDLPLTLQAPLCTALDTPRRLGLYVTPSSLLNPGKSVTAVIGLSDRPQPRRIRGCAFCSMAAACTLRKRGKSCAP